MASLVCPGKMFRVVFMSGFFYTPNMCVSSGFRTSGYGKRGSSCRFLKGMYNGLILGVPSRMLVELKEIEKKKICFLLHTRLSHISHDIFRDII